MNKTVTCAFCDHDTASARTYSDRMKFGRRVVKVEGLSKLVCSHCGSDSVTEEMHDANLASMRSALERTQAAVSSGALKTFRECWSLSQKNASRLFGAGGASFGKWESGQSVPSTPTALLLQCAAKFPQVVFYLALLSDVKLADRRTVRRHCSAAHDDSKYRVVRLADEYVVWGSWPQLAAKPLPMSEPKKPDWDSERVAVSRISASTRMAEA